MSKTTEEMKDIAKTIAREITEQGAIHGCSKCIVDDYGRYGNFSLVCYLKVNAPSAKADGFWCNARAIAPR